VHAGWPVAILGFAVLYLTLPQFAGDILFSVAGLLPVPAVLVGIRLHKVRAPLHSYLLLVSIVLMAVPGVAWIVQVDIQGHPTNDPRFYLAAAAGYLCSMAGSAVIVARHAPSDPGGVLHAAMVGLGLSGLPWAFAIRPTLLASDIAPLMQTVAVIVVMSLMTIMGSLLRVVATTRQAKAPLFYLFVAMVSSLVATALTNMNLDVFGNHPRWVDTVWFVAYFSVSAAVLHPATAYLTTPQRAYPADMSMRGLLSTGLVLSINPVISVGSLFVGVTPDVLLMSMSVLISVPLLLTRFWYLTAQRIRAEQALAHQAAHDELTGLPNRRTVLDRVDGALRQLQDGSLDAVAVLFCDLDGFKPINDGLGHQAGDEVLRVVGQRLRRSVKASDVVGRFGGDEFLVICTGMSGRSVEEVVDRLRANLTEPIVVSGGACTVGASFGVAVATAETSLSADALIAAADHAMYRVKHSRRDTGRAA
jgi:diguanylate cyclase (GGDEF)-like protein